MFVVAMFICIQCAFVCETSQDSKSTVKSPRRITGSNDLYDISIEKVVSRMAEQMEVFLLDIFFLFHYFRENCDNYCKIFVGETPNFIISYRISLVGKNRETATDTKKHVWKP